MNSNAPHDHIHGDPVAASESVNSHEKIEGSDKSFTDPVCGMKVAADPQMEIEYEGNKYYFCSTKCIHKFEAVSYTHLTLPTTPYV